MTDVGSVETVVDPVGHISISGVHGRDELALRLANAPRQPAERPNPLAVLVVGALVGATAMYLFTRD